MHVHVKIVFKRFQQFKTNTICIARIVGKCISVCNAVDLIHGASGKFMFTIHPIDLRNNHGCSVCIKAFQELFYCRKQDLLFVAQMLTQLLVNIAK